MPVKKQVDVVYLMAEVTPDRLVPSASFYKGSNFAKGGK